MNTLLVAPIPYFENNAKEHLKFLKECATYWNIPKPSLIHYVSKPHPNASTLFTVSPVETHK